MKQNEIIQVMREKIFPYTSGINAALLIGSLGRHEFFTEHSDIDFSLWINKDDFSQEQFITLINQHILSIQKILPMGNSKIVVYFENQPKMEFLIFEKKEELDCHFLGSEIDNITDNIVFSQNDCIKNDLLKHLLHAINEKQNKLPEMKKEKVREFATKFVYNFENASSMHYRSDAYKFYFNYTLALFDAVKIAYIARGSMKHYYLPKNFEVDMTQMERDSFHELAGSLYLPDANKKKRLLLNYFYNAVEKANVHTKSEIEDMKNFLENVYSRDYLFNFRDIALFNPKCKKGVIFRTSCFVRYQHDSDIFSNVMNKNSISTIIDLRTNEEISKKPYDMELLKKYHIRYLNISMNIHRPQHFADEIPNYTEMEKQYRWFALGNKDFFKSFFTQVNPQRDVTMIHCYVGKDRTGVLCALIAYIMEETKENIEIDYLASECDVNINYIRAFLSAIDETEGAESFILSCGISYEQLQLWKNALQNR